MILARARGKVISTMKSEKLSGYKLLIVTPIDIDSFQETGAPVVSVDTVGAGEGDVVLVVGGSSARQTDQTENRPVDSAIVAVIDSVFHQEKCVYEK